MTRDEKVNEILRRCNRIARFAGTTSTEVLDVVFAMTSPPYDFDGMLKASEALEGGLPDRLPVWTVGRNAGRMTTKAATTASSNARPPSRDWTT